MFAHRSQRSRSFITLISFVELREIGVFHDDPEGPCAGATIDPNTKPERAFRVPIRRAIVCTRSAAPGSKNVELCDFLTQ
jgi:hypothetical protein